jgi:hypothetical protein
LAARLVAWCWGCSAAVRPVALARAGPQRTLLAGLGIGLLVSWRVVGVTAGWAIWPSIR